METNTYRQAGPVLIGSSASASSISLEAAEHLRQRQLRRPAVGQPDRTCRAPTPALLESFSLLTGSFTSWVAVTPIMSSSLIRLSTTRWLTRGRPSQPLTPTLLRTTWPAVYLT